MTTYYKVQDPHAGDIYWCIDHTPEGIWLRADTGNFLPRCEGDVILATVEAVSPTDLDWTGTSIVNTEGRVGWLDRSGILYRCGPWQHDKLALYILKVWPGDLEDRGWVRINEYRGHWYCQRRLSPEQSHWLSENGYTTTDKHGNEIDGSV